MKRPPYIFSNNDEACRPAKCFGWLALLWSFGLLCVLPATAQPEFAGLQHLFTTPKSYVVQHTTDTLTVDGRLQESAWQQAAWTDDFTDIEGSLKPRPALRTQAKMLWNDSTLFIAARLQEPQVWATQTHHDDIIFKDNDFEVFIDPDNNTHQYFEIEINALNQLFDLFLPKPYRNGGDALIGWNAPGLKTAVQVQGTLNNAGDTDEGWIVEMAIPLKELRIGYPTHLPEEGSLWRINFSRVEWDTGVINGRSSKRKDAGGRDLPEHNWVWSPQGVIDMHFPERWGYLLFARKPGQRFELPYAEKQKQYLWLVYYRQKEYLHKHKRYAIRLSDLHIAEDFTVGTQPDHLLMEATPHRFWAQINAAGQAPLSINDEGLVQVLKKE